MNVLEKFESAMQGLVEGSFGRIFRARLHPVELARKLEGAMERQLTLAPGRRIAPNVYEVYLSPRDSQQFTAYTRTLTQQLQDSLIDVARRRGYMLTSRPLVIFHVDERLVTGEVHIDARLAEPQTVAGLAAGLAEEAGEPAEGIDATRSLSPDEQQELAQEMAQARAGHEAMPQAWLTLRRPDGGGQVYRLDRPIIHIGRHVTNEVVVNDRRVSRYHAEIRYERGQFLLYDLGSLNGVAVNGKVVRQPVVLHDNDQISVGTHDFIFQRR